MSKKPHHGIIRTRNWFARNLAEIAIVCAGLIFVHAIFFSSAFKLDSHWFISDTKASQVGDFIGGYFGTIFALLSVVLLVTTLKRQSQVFARERFESHFFQLISLHRSNVGEMVLRKSNGRRVFSLLLDEFRSLHRVTLMLARNQKKNFSQLDLLRISYYFFFLGVGPNSTRMVRHALGSVDREFIKLLEEFLILPQSLQAARNELNADASYKPYQGHQLRLGHYYRHLYQTLKFVDSQPQEIDRYFYGKTVRAQLSTQEQALLLLNSLTPMGNSWWERGYITRYALVKNLPEGFFEPTTEIDPTELFPSSYFEWQQRAWDRRTE